MDFERSGATLLGVVTYGVQLITYVEDPDGNNKKIWLAYCATTKTVFPNRLGVTVGGSLPSDEAPFQCVI